MKSITVVVLSMLFMPFSILGQTEGSILDVREHIEVESTSVYLTDLLEATDHLPEELKTLEVLAIPMSTNQQQLSLVDLAYKLQRFPALLSYHLRGPDSVVIEHKPADIDMEQGPESTALEQAPADVDLSQEPLAILAEQSSTEEHLPARLDDVVSERASLVEDLEQTRQRVAQQIRKIEPWASWKTKIAFSLRDDRHLEAMRPFERLTLQPLDELTKRGPVTFRVTFFDEHGKEVSECSIAPDIWRLQDVVHLGNSFKQGHQVSAEDLSLSPAWVGDDHVNFLTQIDDCVGVELTCDLAGGEILQEGHLRKTLAAKQLEWLNRIASQQGSISDSKGSKNTGQGFSLAGNIK